MASKVLVTLGMFIIDTFSYQDSEGNDLNVDAEALEPAIGGGGTYSAVGARIWLPPTSVGMIVDRGRDFPRWVQDSLESYGVEIWMFRDQADVETTKAVNIYRGDMRAFAYLTPRIRLTPRDLLSTPLEKPHYLHFICSPQRAKVILSEIDEILDWSPTCVYEPIPDRCVPEELPALQSILSRIHVLSPNAEEALSLLSFPKDVSPDSVEKAANSFLEFGAPSVIIRSGALGAYVLSAKVTPGVWIPAFFGLHDTDHVVDVTGAGNAFLGGLVAGLSLTHDDLVEASLYATVSASYTIEQKGLPRFSRQGEWNSSQPKDRLDTLKHRIMNRTT